MADLISILSNAANSLGAQRALSSTAAHNLENVNTPGYSRQRAHVVATLPAESVGGIYIGRGAQLAGVTQARDRFVELQVPRVLGESARSTAEAEALEAVRALDPERPGSLNEAIGAFYAGLQTLSQNPGDAGLRATALASARTLASAFNRTSEQLQAQRAGLDARLQGYADEVNAAARAVADANAAIRAASAAGGAPNDLLDLRQRSVDRLAELTGATPVPQGDSAVSLVLPGGGALVSGVLAARVTLEPDPANGGLARPRLVATDGSTSIVRGDAFGGAIGGTFAARDGATRQALDDVDRLAFDLAGALDAVHAAGTGLDGVSGRPMFAVGATAAGAAATLRVALADASQLATAGSAATLPGDPANAIALVATQRQALSGGKDVQATLSALTSAFGAESRRASAYAEQDAGMRDHLLAMRESVSGVSVDEELIEMQKAQRAFEAITRVIQVADEMTQALLRMR
jgi:flagellar hook-associated protein 1 FlgK